jgi:GntR family transcriptional regulator, phosphonate transport system regulatory protein
MARSKERLVEPITLPEGNAAEPLWSQAEQALATAIGSGRFRKGERLPSELELAASLGLHRHTVRRAVEALVERGVLEIRRGRGTYLVEGAIPYVIGSRSRFTQNIKASGRSPSTKVISSSMERASADAARWLAVVEGTPLIALTLLRSADSVPVVLARHLIPADRFADFVDRFREIGSITNTYASYGVVGYTRRATKISARLPTHREATVLKITRGSPLLVWTSLNVDPEGIPVNLDDSAFAAGRIDVLMDVGCAGP